MSVERNLEETEKDVEIYKKWHNEYRTRYFKTRMHLAIVGLCFLVSLYFAGINCDASWTLAKENKKLEQECSVYKEDLKEFMDHVKTEP